MLKGAHFMKSSVQKLKKIILKINVFKNRPI